MIIATLNGGLGNQLFQYAAGKALSLKKGVPLYLDISGFDHLPEGTTKRVYELKPFRVSAAPATASQVEKLAAPAFAGRLWDRAMPYYRRHVYQEPFYHYDPHFFDASPNTLLKGYWQSERYFKNYHSVIREELSVHTPLSAATQALAQKIASVNAVSFHIRRGDYATDAKTQSYHGLCSPEYYREALRVLMQRISAGGPDAGGPGGIELFVFSDDIPWAKANRLTEFPVTFVEHNDSLHSFEDLYLMSRCKHHIIANSSFSWWGAWLNDQPGKVVIAPAKWFARSDADTKDLIPAEWLRV
ncbi:alpha-1,2-fucosyltransferase [Puia sp.]|uniref:alpha-1,2-fucosyltransferase n=1 Tax=Puia sp. TaxID=2045100 RepID=UPI002F3E6CE1